MKRVTDEDFIGRRVVKLLQNDISYYAMHTNYDVLGMAKLAEDILGIEKTYVLDVTMEKDGAEEGIGRKRDDRDSVLMIGDREHDILGAKQTGIHSMGVLYGYGSREELEKPERSGSRRHRDRFGKILRTESRK